MQDKTCSSVQEHIGRRLRISYTVSELQDKQPLIGHLWAAVVGGSRAPAVQLTAVSCCKAQKLRRRLERIIGLHTGQTMR